MNSLALVLFGALALGQSDALSPSESRRDPWVFRSVLDGRARMLTAVLREDLWVGYDAGTCALYGAWSGGVAFEGAVYDTVHGPQPSVIGPFLLSPDAGLAESAPAPWLGQRVADGAPLALEVRYRGYRLDHSEAPGLELLWELTLPDGTRIEVRERPSAMGAGEMPARGLPENVVGLRRVFEVSGLPDGVHLQLFGGLWLDSGGSLSSRTGSGVESVAFNSRAAPADRMAPLSKSGASGPDEMTPWYLSLGDGRHTLDFVLSAADAAVEESE